ncbi:hypothetical protein ACQP00_18420 [Dactylosporangium sp. CS-047395]|uniref:hypothetical protein n=1 Tax=Dactylosporangium sp. CS-047395 TaxID=3239936 RepID=UPI003D938080
MNPLQENPLQELRDLDGPGTALTADGLLRAGRARVRRRRQAVVGLAAVLVLVLTVGSAAIAGLRQPPQPADRGRPYPAPTSGLPSAPPNCDVQMLPLPSGVEGTGPPVIDSTGHWAAGLMDTHTGVVIWRDGVILSVDGDEQVQYLHAVNASGTAVGTANVAGRSAAVTFTDRMNVLPLPGGVPVSASLSGSGINAAGTVVGYYTAAEVSKPVLWRDGKAELLTVPGGSGAALWISDDGWVGGIVGRLYDAYRPYVWRPDGTGFELPLPDGVGKGMVNAIAGEWAVDFDNHVRWRLTTPGTPAPQPFSVAQGIYVRALAADGTVTLSGSKMAAVWGFGDLVGLALPAGFSKYQMGGISADGRVIGGAAQHLMDANTFGGSPFRWVC